jgi:hypothetical protein
MPIPGSPGGHNSGLFDPSQIDWNQMSSTFGEGALWLARASFALMAVCLYPPACAEALVLSKVADLASAGMAWISSFTDCIGNSWDQKCVAGLIYSTGFMAITTPLPPVASGIVNQIGLEFWKQTKR